MDYNYYAPRNQTWRYSYAHRNEEFPVGTVSEFEINEEDWNNNAIDVLDLDVMAKKFEEHRRLQQTEKQNVAEPQTYWAMTENEVSEMNERDRLLKQVYDMYYKRDMKKFPGLRRKFKKMIQRLEQKPHIYSPYERDESTTKHVERWLTSASCQTSEPEIVGLTSCCPLELRRRVPNVEPRACKSAINICSRKRMLENDDVVLPQKFSSDTRLVRVDDVRATVTAKRRKTF